MQMDEIVGKSFLDCGRRLLNVEHVATHKQSVWLFFLAPLFQLMEEVAMFITPVVVLVDDLPQMQVGCMQYLHSVVNK